MSKLISENIKFQRITLIIKHNIEFYMEYVILFILIVFLIIYLLAQDSKKDSKKERYGEAVGELAKMAADTISSAAHNITEPVDKKKFRMAQEQLANRNGTLYRFNQYSDKKYIERLFTIDEYFKNALNTIGLSEDRWKNIALMIFYIGAIRKLSRDSFDYSEKSPKYMREYLVNNWSTNFSLKYHFEILKNALNFFNIEIQEWIEYGDTVIEMYDLYDNPDMKEFGIINSIMPMKNNMHLL